MSILYLVVPCYNEEEMLQISAQKMLEKLQNLIASGLVSSESRIMLVDDGSRDKTWDIIENLHNTNPYFRGVKLSRNRGHQNALLAGLMTATEFCDCAVSMDADLQDDIGAIDEMVAKFNEGYEVVYGVRSARETDTAFKRSTAEGFYKLMGAMGANIVYNHADYRLLSKRALQSLGDYHEANLFLRGIVPMLGYRSCNVYYERGIRVAGESKYPLKKMLAFAWEGITSLTIKPIIALTFFGATLSSASAISAIILAIIGKLSWELAIIIAMAFFSGINIFAIGIVGQYVGKAYIETKRRPRYIIETVL